MTAAVKKLFEEARKLPPEERADLVDMLIVDEAKNQSPGVEMNPEIKRAWAEEAERRLEAYEKGEAKAMDGEEILRKLLAGRRP